MKVLTPGMCFRKRNPFKSGEDDKPNQLHTLCTPELFVPSEQLA